MAPAYVERRSLQCYRARRADGGGAPGYCLLTTSTTYIARCLPASVDPVAFGGEIVTRRDFCWVCSFSSFKLHIQMEDNSNLVKYKFSTNVSIPNIMLGNTKLYIKIAQKDFSGKLSRKDCREIRK